MTKYKREEIEFCEYQEEDREARHKYKFYCPICLRYFTHMLQSACCKNYLCHLCVEDLQLQEFKVEDFKATCPYNCTGDIFKLTDVPLEDKAKRYSDSQYMSFYSNNIANNKAAKTMSSHQGNTIRSNMLSSLKEDKENLHPL